MDPETTLNTIRALTDRDSVRDAETTQDIETLRAAYLNLAMAIFNLDAWISRGGFLPRQWRPVTVNPPEIPLEPGIADL